MIFVILAGEYSDKHVLYTTSDRDAADNFVKAYNHNLTYGQAWIEDFEDYVPTCCNKFDESVCLVRFNKKYEFQDWYRYEIAKYYFNHSIAEFDVTKVLETGICITEDINFINIYFLFKFQDDTYTEDYEREKLKKIGKDYLMEFIYAREIDGYEN